jgi:Uma2 family endonuclease
MSLPQTTPPGRRATAEDYWNLPDGVRAELVDGVLYNMAPPSWTHQKIVAGLLVRFGTFIENGEGACQVVPSPVAVRLMGDDSTWVEPDVVVVCDPAKISERGVEGAPDLVVEVASPSNRSYDYLTKGGLYLQAGVREYWIVDPEIRRTVIYRFEEGAPFMSVFDFDVPVPVGIYDGALAITVGELV